MSEINRALVKNLAADEVTYNRGVRYYSSKAIKSISKSKSREHYRAIVQGKSNYTVDIDLTNPENIEYKCNCPGSRKHPGACKHAVAVMLFINDYSDRRKQQKIESGEKRRITRILDYFDNMDYMAGLGDIFHVRLGIRLDAMLRADNSVKAAVSIWRAQNKYMENKRLINISWNWINLTIPVISSTFASFSRMLKNIDENVLGHTFVDEAGQALPQAAVGAIFRSKNIMVVGDPFQIKPVLTLDGGLLALLSKSYNVSEKYLSESASVQTLVDAASQYGFYTKGQEEADSWIGIPLWVHRRCKYPMFTISNEISYQNLMVQGNEGYGKTGWYDIKGKAVDKYVEEQGEFLLKKIQDMAKSHPKILDKNESDTIYIISPFKNVAYRLARKLDEIGFTRRENGKVTNIGTIHTFQGKEAPIVFMVLGADTNSKGAASWAVGEANMMNVAATRAKKEFYIVGDKKLYMSLGSEVISKVNKVITAYSKEHPELIDENTDLGSL